MTSLALLLLCMIAPEPQRAPVAAPPVTELRAIAWHDAPRAPARAIQAESPRASELREPFATKRAAPAVATAPRSAPLREPFVAAPRTRTAPATPPHATEHTGLREPFPRQ